MYTIKEICKELKVSQRTIYNWIEAGEIKTIKLGQNHRISEEELERIKKEGISL